MWCSKVAYGAAISFLLDLYFPRILKNQNGAMAALEQSSINPSSTMSTNSSTSASDPYKSSRFVGHSLWMIPTGDALKAYSDIVDATARELDTFHFLPHITLVAALMNPVEEVVEQTRRLAGLLTPYQCELDDLSQRDAYFQCVFATMKITDSVVHANSMARQIFPEKQSDPPYMPHLSLIYGDFSEERKLNELIPKLRQRLEGRAPDTLRIPVDAIEIWSTQGDVKDWYLVERVPLTGQYPNNQTS